MVTHARCSCIAAKLNYSISYVNGNLSIGHTHTVQRQQLHAFFSIALCLGFGSSSPALAPKAGSAWSANTRWRSGCSSWHFTQQIRQEVFTIRNDIADPSCICLRQTTFCTYSTSIQQGRRSVHTLICQGKAVMFCQGIVLFRANSYQGFETKSAASIFEVTQTNIPALLGWDTSSAREAPWILQRIVDMQCNLQTVLESCHFFEANVNHQVLRLQISFLFDFALQASF